MEADVARIAGSLWMEETENDTGERMLPCIVIMY